MNLDDRDDAHERLKRQNSHFFKNDEAHRIRRYRHGNRHGEVVVGREWSSAKAVCMRRGVGSEDRKADLRGNEGNYW